MGKKVVHLLCLVQLVQIGVEIAYFVEYRVYVFHINLTAKPQMQACIRMRK